MMRKARLHALAAVALAALLVIPAVYGEDSAEGSITSVFDVDGMTCGGCEAGIRMVLKKLDGVQEVKPSHEDKLVSVTYDPGKITTDKIEAAIEKMGYKASLRKTDRTTT